jgi:hypothetical protein
MHVGFSDRVVKSIGECRGQFGWHVSTEKLQESGARDWLYGIDSIEGEIDSLTQLLIVEEWVLAALVICNTMSLETIPMDIHCLWIDFEEDCNLRVG